jgi:hypothetical protein
MSQAKKTVEDSNGRQLIFGTPTTGKETSAGTALTDAIWGASAFHFG